jgi:polar amino acid transport system substrate-binding protein
MSTSRYPFAILLSLLALVYAATFAGCRNDKSAPVGDATTAAADDRSDCAPDTLKTVQRGKLTVATDSPASEPYFVGNDPANGQGFESAMAYAVADRLGFERADVTWRVVPIENSSAGGEKDFDFALAQIPITVERASLVDFSSPYYEAKQGVVVLENSEATFETIDDLKGLSIGVQSDTTSVHAVEHEIGPDNDPQVFDLANDVLTALKEGQVNAIVADVPTAFYLTTFEMPQAKLAGQFDAHSDAPNATVQWGAVLERHSPMTQCVTAAILDLRRSGELAEIEQKWMSDEVDVPVLTE